MFDPASREFRPAGRPETHHQLKGDRHATPERHGAARDVRSSVLLQYCGARRAVAGFDWQSFLLGAAAAVLILSTVVSIGLRGGLQP